MATMEMKSEGVIVPGECYALKEAYDRMGWTRSAAREARRRGLKVLYVGKCGYLKGEEIIRYLEENAKEKTPA